MVAFAMIAEAGVLEEQARFLAESIRLFAGAHRNEPILVISPRSERRPSARTINALASLDAEYIEYDIKSIAPEYGTSFRVHAASVIERESREDVLVFLDSDIIFAGEPDLDLGGCAVAARPVDVKGMCTSGPGDPFDAYWRALCRVCDVNYDHIPFVTTTVDRRAVKASYNGGFVVAKRSAGVFQRTEDYFARSIASGLRPRDGDFEFLAGHGVVRGRGAHLWGSSQACLSLAVWGVGESVKLLPSTHNFPAHLEAHVASAGMSEPLVAVHYHHLFGRSAGRSMHRRLNLPDACTAWLDGRLPIHP